MYYRRIEKGATSTAKEVNDGNSKHVNQEQKVPKPKEVVVKNSFEVLSERMLQAGVMRLSRFMLSKPLMLLMKATVKRWIRSSNLRSLMVLMVQVQIRRRQALPLMRFLMFNVTSWNILGLNLSLKQSE
ncbi:hypothetical protein Tco_1205298, partial [Tanacetum coccineum]